MATPMNDTPLQRLDRLEAYLQTDPHNQRLLADAFETALLANQWERAEFHLRHGQASGLDALHWALRAADLLLAQQRYPEAVLALEPLAEIAEPPEGLMDVVQHNLVYAEFRQGHYAACIRRLATHLAPRSLASHPPASAVQQMWLRALHRENELAQAMAWTTAAEVAGCLDAQAAGIASLVAIDANDFGAAQRWAAMALKAKSSTPSIEALVAQSSLSLAGRDAVQARQWADAALQLHAQDGRAWSARAFASLLAGDLDTAQADFGHALAHMPGHIGTWHGQAWAQLLQRNLTGAQESFATALGLDRNFAESHGGMAVALALQGQNVAAEEHIERALRLDRGNLSGRYAQAILSGEVQDAQAIQRFAQRVLGQRTAPLGGQMSDWLSATPSEPDM